MSRESSKEGEQVEVVVHTHKSRDDSKSPVLEHLLSSYDPAIKQKKELLGKSIAECITKSKKYFARYSKLKKRDDRLDVIKDTLNACSIGLIVAGLVAFPPALFIAIACNIGNYICTRWSTTLDYKHKYSRDALSSKQLVDLAREMTAVLAKNNLTSEQYMAFIEETNNRIALISDSAIPI
jgi:hypothetical protein